jgi:tellurite methyltransferase
VNDQERWDAKYAGKAGKNFSEPDERVVELLAGIPARGRALDLAAGTGRHALHLAKLGWDTSAWDVSPVGLVVLEERASQVGVEIETLAIDLLAEDPPVPDGGFDLVVCVLFLDRGLFRSLRRFVGLGGYVIFSTVTTDHPAAKPPIQYRLNPGELEFGVPGFETVSVSEVDGRATVLARRIL